MRHLAAFLLIVLSLAGPVPAQQANAPQPAGPVYEPQLMRLSEIMGALHFLRVLCQAPDAGSWRREMQALLEAETTTAERRERLTQSFNRGYQGFERAHRTCTPAAQLASRRYVEEGQRIVADITSRFVN